MSLELPHIQAVIAALRATPWLSIGQIVVATDLTPQEVKNAMSCLRNRCALKKRVDDLTPEERFRFKRATMIRFSVVDEIRVKNLFRPVPTHCQMPGCEVELVKGRRAHYCAPCLSRQRTAKMLERHAALNAGSRPAYVSPIRARALGLNVATVDRPTFSVPALDASVLSVSVLDLDPATMLRRPYG